jgi:hypothetical protein
VLAAAAKQIVNNNDSTTLLQKAFAKVGADKTGATGDY